MESYSLVTYSANSRNPSQFYNQHHFLNTSFPQSFTPTVPSFSPTSTMQSSRFDRINTASTEPRQKKRRATQPTSNPPTRHEFPTPILPSQNISDSRQSQEQAKDQNRLTASSMAPSPDTSLKGVQAPSTGFTPPTYSPNFTFPSPSQSHQNPQTMPGHMGSTVGPSSNPNIDPSLEMFSVPTPAGITTQGYDQPTPGAASASGSAQTDPDKDPFLSLLEQLAENEVSRGGPSELDFFLSGQTGVGSGNGK
jgi:hypothetical protein